MQNDLRIKNCKFESYEFLGELVDNNSVVHGTRYIVGYTINQQEMERNIGMFPVTPAGTSVIGGQIFFTVDNIPEDAGNEWQLCEDFPADIVATVTRGDKLMLCRVPFTGDLRSFIADAASKITKTQQTVSRDDMQER